MNTKLNYLLAIILLFGFTTISKAQAFLGTVNFGCNMAQVDGDEVVGFKKIGFNAGVSAMMPIWEDKVFASVELSFSQKGAYQKYPVESDPTKQLPYYNLRLNYLEIPILAHYYDKQFVMAGFGLSYNRLVGMSEVEWGIKTASSVENKTYTRDDLCILVDIRLPIYQKLKFNFRYNYSLTSIRTRHFTDASGKEWDRKQYNNYLTFRVVYVFNEKKKVEVQGM